MFSAITTNIATGIIVVLFTSWYIWRRREKLVIRYTVTESDFFPLAMNKGKYYAVKIANNGGKMVKSIKLDVTIVDATIESITTHELVKNLKQTGGKVSGFIEMLNPKEEVDFVITAKVKETSKPILKVRGEGVNAEEITVNPSTPTKWDVGGTAAAWAFIGFFGAIVYANVMVEENPINNRMDNIFGILTRSKLPHVFHEIIEHQDDITYEGTAFYLVNSYVKDPLNKGKYLQALKEISETKNIKSTSKGVTEYLIYKISLKEKNIGEATRYIEKCKKDSPETFEYFMKLDPLYNLDSLTTYFQNKQSVNTANNE